ncbi:histidine phosphatase family protein [Enterococcus thailandicus]|uniref:phosphoglycerate mutase (2,3-diphosphoglycerate-dependent) n=1 Tax=Enterococcus thailandicus TaxID=417368 RepID=A0A510WF24_ENTTH|nr:histidine phosphatase family protein [Enterococcus thailandicus]OJG94661.1 phosphoglycerate mutase family protein [Enterococcus thailandicus]GEK37716.1 phosphoglycerate mutase [Enterococcus thailandicus]
MDLYFTRHGKTEWNQERRFQGSNGDSPLLPQSYKEIKALGEKVKNVPFEVIYASTAKRARDTAEGINQMLAHPVEIIFTDKLRELGLGLLEGQKIEEMYERFPENLPNLRNHLDKYDPTPFNGEPITAAITRIETVVADAVAQHDGPILFVGHGASLTAAIQWMTGKELSQLREMGGLFNSSLTILETEEPNNLLPYQLKVWNEVDFLGLENKPEPLL